jgi:hypothetical protein
MDTSDERHEAGAGGGPVHPQLRAGLLMAGIVLFILFMSVASVR